ncbi:MAG: hypothetical protein HY599_05915 [Candidatus Omnitrophica bacterium]|nr:hypothetical protein [Candidatus Omnitrophota bacterium]
MPPSLPPLGSALKVLVPVGLGLAGLGVMGMLYLGQVQQTQRLQQQLAMTQQQVNQLQQQNQEMAQQLDTLQTERQTLDEKVSALRSQLATATASIERSRVSLDELQHRYEGVVEERVQLQQQVERLTGERESAIQEAKRLTQAKTDVERSLAQSRERLTLLDRDYRKLTHKVAELEARPLAGVDPMVTIGPGGTAITPGASAGTDAPTGSVSGAVELPPIIVRKDRAGVSAPVRGRLMEVNREHNFIVVDKGSLDGVRVGMTFEILRSGGVVGRATVVRVRPQLSACDVLRSRTPGPLQVGDVAVQGGS